MKTTEWRFNCWFRFASSSGYLYEFYLYLAWKKNAELNLGESVVMQLSEKLKGLCYTLFFNHFLTAKRRSINFLSIEFLP